MLGFGPGAAPRRSAGHAATRRGTRLLCLDPLVREEFLLGLLSETSGDAARFTADLGRSQRVETEQNAITFVG